MSIEAMKQALEALEKMVTPRNFQTHQFCQKAYDDLRQAIEEAEQELSSVKQEPVAWVDLLEEAQQIVESKFLWKRFIDGTPLANDIACWMADFAQQHIHPQPKREWVGLTDEEAWKCWDWEDFQGTWKSMEAKLKEKNT